MIAGVYPLLLADVDLDVLQKEQLSEKEITAVVFLLLHVVVVFQLLHVDVVLVAAVVLDVVVVLVAVVLQLLLDPDLVVVADLNFADQLVVVEILV